MVKTLQNFTINKWFIMLVISAALICIGATLKFSTLTCNSDDILPELLQVRPNQQVSKRNFSGNTYSFNSHSVLW